MELDAAAKLRRFCFLGSFDPVYQYRGPLEVSENWPSLRALCAQLDDVTFVTILRDLLPENVLHRRDEPIFAYAAYLASDVDIKWKTSVRQAFPALLRSADDMFMFCKYAMLIQKEQKHKGFSRTARKAIKSWYEFHSPEALRHMWLVQHGAHGFTHAALLKLCHVSDDIIGAVDIAPFFRRGINRTAKVSATTVAASTSEIEADKPQLIPTSQQNGKKEESAAKEKAENNNNNNNSTSSSNCGEAVQPTTAVLALCRLRATKNRSEAVRLIRKFKLRYNQVPKPLLSHAPIIEALLPGMSYLQLLKCWREMARHKHLKNAKLFQLMRVALDDRQLLAKSNIHPISFLLQLKKLGIRDDLSLMPTKKVEALKMTELQESFERSFGQNERSGLRMHITLNLQQNYRKKHLKNHKSLKFYEAAVAIAFGYYAKEDLVDVHYWNEEKLKLGTVEWTKEHSFAEAKAICDKIEIKKNSQRLIAPIMSALQSKNVYDVFLAIVPSAGRSNPKKSSELLCKFLTKYREMKNSKAKYVILDLMRFKQSMSYSTTCNENILEICGLDENTTQLVANYALNRFG